ncbi:MAG TPA: protein-glutamate O-methyltransferase CheR [Pseudobacteroides sp.]|uniref:CheR family methyltransferase n=1 Tax=Pseudobacteroides sp. TaxID=1968840 RepID=UPI002F92AACD
MDLNIHYIQNSYIKNISVIGEIETKEDTERLLRELEASNILEFNITFIGANTLNTRIVEKISYLRKILKCKIYVLKRFLYLYLQDLGIKCEYVLKKSLHAKLNNKTPISELRSLDTDMVNRFLENIRLKFGYDYTGYQIDSVIRRINITMLRENISCFEQFEAAVLKEPEIFEQLFLDLSINTTGFFRDPDVFLMLRNRILTYLCSYSHIKIWCVGCSSGKEPYSLAILLYELGLLNKTYIYATDINPYIIEEAKNGLFSTSNIDKDILNYQKSGGTRNFVDYFDLNDSYMKIKSHLQKNILFFQHSVIGNGILNEFQLILCRNVLIYLTPQTQEKVLFTLSKSLDFTGFLVLGKSEGMLLNGGHSFFVNYLAKEKIYRLKQSI